MYTPMRITLLAAAAVLACAASAQTAVQVPSADAVRAAAQKAIAANPEVTAKLNALRASDAAVDIVRGGLRPALASKPALGAPATASPGATRKARA
jgi:outer membrane protein, adhesin transport system